MCSDEMVGFPPTWRANQPNFGVYLAPCRITFAPIGGEKVTEKRKQFSRFSESKPHAALYKTARWASARMQQLQKEPLCRMCTETGHVSLAEVVDHITPHKGAEHLFFDHRNFQSLCKSCHDRHKQREERTGTPTLAFGHDRLPTSKTPHW